MNETKTVWVERLADADTSDLQSIHNRYYPGNHLAIKPSINVGKVWIKVACTNADTPAGAVSTPQLKPVVLP
jgi:hypothetical protein